jgi:hypothetical protein
MEVEARRFKKDIGFETMNHVALLKGGRWGLGFKEREKSYQLFDFGRYCRSLSFVRIHS